MQLKTGLSYLHRAAMLAALGIGATASFAQLAPTTQPRPGDQPTQTAQPVQVERAWVRARLPKQDSTAGYMQLTAANSGARLVGASSKAAASVELHETKMDGNVMRMRPVDAIELPAGQRVELKPGGYHLMLLGLKTPLASNTSVPLILTFQAADGSRRREEMQVPVSTSEPPPNLTGPARGPASAPMRGPTSGPMR